MMAPLGRHATTVPTCLCEREKESYRYDRNKNEGKCSGKREFWWYFPPTIIVKPLFSHFLHSYQLLLDEIVTPFSRTLSISYIFFSHFAWEGWEMISLSWFWVTVWPKSWVQKKYFIQETICSVSKCLKFCFVCLFVFYICRSWFVDLKG